VTHLTETSLVHPTANKQTTRQKKATALFRKKQNGNIQWRLRRYTVRSHDRDNACVIHRAVRSRYSNSITESEFGCVHFIGDTEYSFSSVRVPGKKISLQKEQMCNQVGIDRMAVSTLTNE